MHSYNAECELSIVPRINTLMCLLICHRKGLARSKKMGVAMIVANESDIGMDGHQRWQFQSEANRECMHRESI